MTFRILTVIGARPQIIKAAAISRAIHSAFSHALEEVLLHTGQHYDTNMSATFFGEMGIPAPGIQLQAGGGSHGAQTARMLTGIEEALLETKPNAVMVYGDTNSTLAAGIAASKLHIPVVHVEAGLRSFNKRMPEEINRIMCDHASTLLFSPTLEGVKNLSCEGFDIAYSGRADVNHPKVFHCGDVMYDNSLFYRDQVPSPNAFLESHALVPGKFALVTIHRDHNTDDPNRLNALFRALLSLAKDYDLVMALPLHPRTRKMMDIHLDAALLAAVLGSGSIRLMPPASFLEVIALEKHCSIVLTDSGGVQKEAYFFRKPCLIFRPETEWVELVRNGNAALVDADELLIQESFNRMQQKSDYTWPPLFGDGQAASFICRTILEELS
jgi:UDP-GlcNAc3NAcA epimerase